MVLVNLFSQSSIKEGSFCPVSGHPWRDWIPKIKQTQRFNLRYDGCDFWFLYKVCMASRRSSCFQSSWWVLCLSGRRGQDRINSHTLHINKPKSKIEVILDQWKSSKQSIALWSEWGNSMIERNVNLMFGLILKKKKEGKKKSIFVFIPLGLTYKEALLSFISYFIILLFKNNSVEVHI